MNKIRIPSKKEEEPHMYYNPCPLNIELKKDIWNDKFVGTQNC